MLRAEFDRQVENLVQRGYPQVAGIEAEEFLRHVEPLRERIGDLPALGEGVKEGRVPFVIVVKSGLVPGEKAMSLVELKGKSGFTTMDADDIKRFQPIEGLGVPATSAYLLVDIDAGKATLNVTPDEALEILRRENRSPLTIDEGIAVITHHPEILRNSNCFYMLGSRCGDRRVTALWISRGKPRLGWCWSGNPHSWLGSASCGGRVGS